MQSQLSARMVDEYKTSQQRFAKNVIRDILRDPENHINHVHRQAGLLFSIIDLYLREAKSPPNTLAMQPAQLLP